MSIIKRRRLTAKRTPWAKTRWGRRAHARADLMRIMVLRQGLANIQAIRSAVVSDKLGKLEKSLAIADAVIGSYNAAASIPVCGRRTA